MPVAQDTAKSRLAAAPLPGERAHTDSVAAFVPDQSRAERTTSYDLADFPIPGGREEDWRFAPVDRLGALFQVEPTDESRLTVDIAAPQGVTISEATVSKIGDDQLFYLMSRGMTEQEAMAMIVRGFIEPIARELPMEYALELNRLIELQMEGAVG